MSPYLTISLGSFLSTVNINKNSGLVASEKIRPAVFYGVFASIRWYTTVQYAVSLAMWMWTGGGTGGRGG